MSDTSEIEIVCSHRKLNKIEEEKIIIDLERSAYAQARKRTIQNLRTPTISEIKENLGINVANVVFENCPEEQQIELGLIPPLIGPDGQALWTSPSDLLIGKVCLKPPLTSKHIKALTHQGILEIGAKIERKYWNQMEMEKEVALMEQKADLMFCFKKELQKSLVCLGVRLQEECQAKIAALSDKFENELRRMLQAQEHILKDELQKKFNKICDVLVQQERHCEATIKEAVEKTVRDMCQLFIEDLEKQHALLCQYFGAEMKRVQIQNHYEAQLRELHFYRQMKNLKHHLECRNVANMMYVLCMERRKCNTEKFSIEEYYKKEISKLNEIIDKQGEEINKLQEEREEKILGINLREKCIMQILKQFQKFINFALQATPTQAEFLLSTEKLLVMELTDALQNIREEGVNKLKRREEPPLKKWKQGPSATSSVHSLTAKDHHMCYREVEPTLKFLEMEGRGADFVVPAVNWNNLLYIREDFRDLVASGAEVTRDHDLWSPDVELLIQKFRQVAENVPKTYRFSSDDELPICKKRIKPDEKLIVTFEMDKISEEDEEGEMEEDKEEISWDSQEICNKENLFKPCKPPGICVIGDASQVTAHIDYQKIGEVEQSKTILSAKDSLELYRLSLAHIKHDETTESSSSRTTEILDTQYDDIMDYLKWLELDTKEHPEPPDFTKVTQQPADDEEIIADTTNVLSYEHILAQKRLSGKDAPKPDTVSVATKSGKVGVIITPEAKLAIATKDSIIQAQDALWEEKKSRLSDAKDSLDLLIDLELKPNHSKLLTTKSSLEIFRKSTTSLKVCGKCKCTGLKTVSTVSFSTRDKLMNVIHPIDKLYEPEIEDKLEPDIVKKKKPCIPKVEHKCKIVGERYGKEFQQNPVEFTSDRINSLISLIKDNPKLLGLFTSVSK